MKKGWITLAILLAYAVLTVILTLSVVYSYNLLGETVPMFNEDPLIKLIVSGFPMLQAFAVITVLAFIGIRKASSEHKPMQCIAVQPNKEV